MALLKKKDFTLYLEPTHHVTSDRSHTHIEFVKNEIFETLGRLDVMPSLSGKNKESSPLVQTALFYKRHDTVSRADSSCWVRWESHTHRVGKDSPYHTHIEFVKTHHVTHTSSSWKLTMLCQMSVTHTSSSWRMSCVTRISHAKWMGNVTRERIILKKTAPAAAWGCTYPAYLTEILKSQLAAIFTLQTEYRAKFWEILFIWIIMPPISVIHEKFSQKSAF